MLAAKTAWMILETEHRHMRRLLDDIAALVAGEAWHADASRCGRLGRLIDELESFDHGAHRPKGTAMIEAMSGRSADADRHLASMTDGRARTDDVLRHAKALLGAVRSGEPAACHACQAMLAGYREVLMKQMNDEETLLRAHSEDVLTEEEWSRLLSSISMQVQQRA